MTSASAASSPTSGPDVTRSAAAARAMNAKYGANVATTTTMWLGGDT